VLEGTDIVLGMDIARVHIAGSESNIWTIHVAFIASPVFWFDHRVGLGGRYSFCMFSFEA
jgi:hypothetical protein